MYFIVSEGKFILDFMLQHTNPLLVTLILIMIFIREEHYNTTIFLRNNMFI